MVALRRIAEVRVSEQIEPLARRSRHLPARREKASRRQVPPEVMRVALQLADGDYTRLLVTDEGHSITILNWPRGREPRVR